VCPRVDHQHINCVSTTRNASLKQPVTHPVIDRVLADQVAGVIEQEPGPCLMPHPLIPGETGELSDLVRRGETTRWEVGCPWQTTHAHHTSIGAHTPPPQMLPGPGVYLCLEYRKSDHFFLHFPLFLWSVCLFDGLLRPARVNLYLVHVLIADI